MVILSKALCSCTFVRRQKYFYYFTIIYIYLFFQFIYFTVTVVTWYDNHRLNVTRDRSMFKNSKLSNRCVRQCTLYILYFISKKNIYAKSSFFLQHDIINCITKVLINFGCFWMRKKLFYNSMNFCVVLWQELLTLDKDLPFLYIKIYLAMKWTWICKP